MSDVMMTCCCLDDDPPSCECENPLGDSITLTGYFGNRWTRTTYSEKCDQYPGQGGEEQAATIKRVDNEQFQTYCDWTMQMVCTGGTVYTSQPQSIPPIQLFKEIDRRTVDKPYGYSDIDINRVCQNGQPQGTCVEFSYAYADINVNHRHANPPSDPDAPAGESVGGRCNTRLYLPDAQGNFGLPQWVLDLGIVPIPDFVYRITEVTIQASTRGTLNQYDRSYLPYCQLFAENNYLFDDVYGINWVMGDSRALQNNNGANLLEVSVLPFCDHRMRGSVIWDGSVIRKTLEDGYEYIDLPDELQETETIPGDPCGLYGQWCGHPGGDGDDEADTEITVSWRCDGKITGWS